MKACYGLIHVSCVCVYVCVCVCVRVNACNELICFLCVCV